VPALPLEIVGSLGDGFLQTNINKIPDEADDIQERRLAARIRPDQDLERTQGLVHALQAAEISRFDSGNQLMPSSILYKLDRQGRLSYFDSMRMA
jgi:hypothetical protein